MHALANAPLAFPIWLHGPDFGRHAEATAAGDWFVLATLAFLFFLLACFGLWAWLLWRRERHPRPHVQLLMELRDTDPPESENSEPPPPKLTAEAWERPAEWWRR